MEYVTVYRAWGEAEAQVVRGLLESSGIECRLLGRGPQFIYPVTVDGLAEVQIMVPKGREAEAKAIVAAYRDKGESR
ncbi:MAG: putative signal transducing protein [Candidatus Bipolaricaulia bacterium]